jgi:hypothetical protein
MKRFIRATPYRGIVRRIHFQIEHFSDLGDGGVCPYYSQIRVIRVIRGYFCLMIRTLVGAAVDFTNYIVSILISLFVGLVGLIVAYKIFDWMTPGVNFSDQLNADNRAVAIFLAGLFIGLGLLLGNAIK